MSDHGAVEREGPRAHIVSCRLPVAVYEWLRLKAFQTRRSMNSITVEAVRVYRVEVDAGRATVKGQASRGSERVMYNAPVDNELYEWLRTAAFYARTSISAVIVAALVYAQAAQPEGGAGS